MQLDNVDARNIILNVNFRLLSSLISLATALSQTLCHECGEQMHLPTSNIFVNPRYQYVDSTVEGIHGTTTSLTVN